MGRSPSTHFQLSNRPMRPHDLADFRSRSPHRGATLVFVLLTILSGVSGCAVEIGSGRASGGEGEDKKEAVPLPVSVIQVSQQTLVIATKTTTVLRPIRSVVVKSELAGVIAELPIEEGSSLDKGGLLAKLDSRALKLELDKARLSWDRSQRNLVRQKEMLGEKLTSEREYEQAYFDERLAANAVEIVEHQIELATIEAPFTGVVAERMAEVGQTINVGQEIARVVSMDPLEADLHLPVRDAWALKVGDEVQLMSDRLPVGRLIAHVLRIAPVVDEKTGTAKVVLRVPSVEGVKPGVFLEAELVQQRIEGALIIPREAVLFRGTEPIVYRVEDSKPLAVTVKIGAQTESSFQIIEGLSVGNSIVLEGAGGLKPDSLIRVLPSTTDPVTGTAVPADPTDPTAPVVGALATPSGSVSSTVVQSAGSRP